MIERLSARMNQKGLLDLLGWHARNMTNATEALSKIFAGDGGASQYLSVISAQKHEASRIARDVLVGARCNRPSPLDHAEIRRLIRSMGDVIHRTQQTAMLANLIPPGFSYSHMRGMTEAVVGSAQLTQEALSLLSSVPVNATRLSALTEQVLSLDEHVGEMQGSGIKLLYETCAAQQLISEFTLGIRIYEAIASISQAACKLASEISTVAALHARSCTNP
jgi:uncharacterized protein Yka (UPF0111/DUF47 family)